MPASINPFLTNNWWKRIYSFRKDILQLPMSERCVMYSLIPLQLNQIYGSQIAAQGKENSSRNILYCGLGVLCLLAARQHLWPMWQQVAIAMGISFGYAVFDELHQLFVSGRAFLVSDIALDSIAASVGILLVGLIHYWLNNG